MLTEEEKRAYIKEEVHPWWDVIKDELGDVPDELRAEVLATVIRDPYYWKDARDKAKAPPKKTPAKKETGQETLEGDVKPEEKKEGENFVSVVVSGGTFKHKEDLKRWKLVFSDETRKWSGDIPIEAFKDFVEWIDSTKGVKGAEMKIEEATGK